MRVAQVFGFDSPNRRITSGAMGFGLPAAIGAQIANPGRLVIGIAGERIGADDDERAIGGNTAAGVPSLSRRPRSRPPSIGVRFRWRPQKNSRNLPF
jgi:hypothetical protein